MFKTALENILERTEGSLGALIMGTDGIAVEKLLREEGREANLDVAAAECTSLVRSAKRTGNDINLGTLREMVLSYEDMHILIRTFNDEYFIVVAIAGEGNLGRGRFEMRKAELDLAREFVF